MDTTAIQGVLTSRTACALGSLAIAAVLAVLLFAIIGLFCGANPLIALIGGAEWAPYVLIAPIGSGVTVAMMALGAVFRARGVTFNAVPATLTLAAYAAVSVASITGHVPQHGPNECMMP